MPIVVASTPEVTGRIYRIGSGGITDRITLSGDSSTVNWSTIFKTADETVNGSNTLQNDDELILSITAGQRLAFEGKLVYFSGTTPDFKYQITGSATPTFYYAHHHAIVPGGTSFASVVISEAPDATGLQQLTNISGGVGFAFFGGVVYSSSAVSLTIQWAQNTANASDTIVYAGSYIRYKLVE